MQINFQDLHELPVETENGTFLGHIIDLQIDVKTLQIKQLEVQDKKWLSSEKKYLISNEQIVSISKDKVVVKDGLVKKTEKILTETIIPAEAAPTLNAEMDN